MKMLRPRLLNVKLKIIFFFIYFYTASFFLSLNMNIKNNASTKA